MPALDPQVERMRPRAFEIRAPTIPASKALLHNSIKRERVS